jgi:L-arabinokinase
MSVDGFLETLKTQKLFEPGTSVTIARAPGRLDVMGGIADYSGSLVLQRPIAEATFAGCQVLNRPVVEVISLGRKPVTILLDILAPQGEPIRYEAARDWFRQVDEDRWAAYVAGVFLVLMRERNLSFKNGVRIVISSTVPEGKGVASSAAVEVATMQAVAGAFGVRIDPLNVALLCQKVENLIAGAPCGVMDQMTSVFGEADSLMALLCQPAELQPPVRLPQEIAFWGLDSGERHSVSGSDYESVRTGAFMGQRLITSMDAIRQGYLANISPSDFETKYLRFLPDSMSGEEFLARYSGTADTVTKVSRDRVYKIRQPTAHPVYEHHRVRRFRELLLASPSEQQRIQLGDLMYQSHASYSACSLGSAGTDLIVNLVRAEGPHNGLYGARITGGGSGGTVAILGRADAGSAIAKVVETYATFRGHRPFVFSGSSPGSSTWGTLTTTMFESPFRRKSKTDR